MTEKFMQEITNSATTLADADLVLVTTDVSTTPVSKKITWANIKATLFGTWTTFVPTYSPTGGTFTGATITTNSARYHAIGKLCHIIFDITITNKGTGSPIGGLVIGGIPYAPEGFGSVFGRENAFTGASINGVCNPNSTITVYKYDNGTLIVDGYNLLISTFFEIA